MPAIIIWLVIVAVLSWRHYAGTAAPKVIGSQKFVPVGGEQSRSIVRSGTGSGQEAAMEKVREIILGGDC